MQPNLQQPTPRPKPTVTKRAPEVSRSRWSLMSVSALLVLLVVSVWSGVTYFGNRGLVDERAELKTTLQRLEAQLGETESKATNGTKQTFIDDRKAERILWTNVIKKVLDTNPRNSEDGQELLTYKSISARPDGNISVNVKTRTSSVNPYIDTAILLRELRRKPFFVEQFIPGISSGKDEVGRELLTYGLTFRYDAAKDTDEDLIELSELIPDDDDSDAVTVDPDAEADNPELDSVIEDLKSRTETTDDLTETDEQ